MYEQEIVAIKLWVIVLEMVNKMWENFLIEC